MFINTQCYSQCKVTKRLIKGHWMTRNVSDEFYKSDTLVFYKKTNEYKDVPKHHGKRPFIESDHIFNEGTPRVEINLDVDFDFRNNLYGIYRRAICSDVSFNGNNAHYKERIWGKWEVKKNILKIHEDSYTWHLKIIRIEKVNFEFDGKTYTTKKMIIIKKKFLNN